MKFQIADLVEVIDERKPQKVAVVFSVSEKYGIVPQSELFVRPIALADRSKYKRIQYGDIVYNPYLLWNGAVGACFDERGGCVSPAYIVLRPRNKGVERFLHYFFRSKRLTSTVDGIASGSVTRRRVAPITDILNLTFDLPDVNHQKIANDLLVLIDNKIKLNQRMNVTLESITQVLFKRWFVDFEFSIENGNCFRSSGGKMVKSELGEIPQGWTVGKISDIAVLSKGAINPSEFPKEVFQHFSIPAFDDGRMPKVEQGQKIKSNKFIVSPDCILISKLNPRIPRVWLPIIPADFRAVASTEFLVIIPKAPQHKDFLHCLFLNSSFSNKYVSFVTGTSGSHQRVRPESLVNMDIIIPPANIIERFSIAVQSLFERASFNITQSRNMAILRNSLMPKLMLD